MIKDKKDISLATNVNYDDEALVHEIKRVGFLIDRFVDLQLRVGDSLVIYTQ